jgi:hypothetical protein
MEAIHRMPTPPHTPETKEILVLGRAGGGPDGTAGGINYMHRGDEFRLEPGDSVEVPSKVAYHLIAEGLAADPSAPTPAVEADPEPEPLPADVQADLDALGGDV